MPGLTRQAGISLLESLVAMSILAVAVLGTLGVQLRTLADTQTSVRRAQSVRLIEDFAERIKTHPETFHPPPDHSVERAPVSARADCRIAACGAGMLAQWDLTAWQQAVADTLPLGTGQVFAPHGQEAGLELPLGVVVAWRANKGGQGDAAYGKPFVIDSPADGAACPAGLFCHLAHVQP